MKDTTAYNIQLIIRHYNPVSYVTLFFPTLPQLNQMVTTQKRHTKSIFLKQYNEQVMGNCPQLLIGFIFPIFQRTSEKLLLQSDWLSAIFPLFFFLCKSLPNRRVGTFSIYNICPNIMLQIISSSLKKQTKKNMFLV